MAYIALNEKIPGIRSLFDAFPLTAGPLKLLAQTLLRGESTLSKGERELIATYVSSENDCVFCTHSHGAAAKHLLDHDGDLIEQVWRDSERAPISDKLKALLNIAGKVADSGRRVTEGDVSQAREEGATDAEIHDTVLIAAAFCMFNRYVDGLKAPTPEPPSNYDEMGAVLASQGYVRKVA